MRVLMLQSAARDQHSSVDQRLDHRIVGITLLTFLGENTFASKAGRLLGEAAVGIDGVGNIYVDPLRRELSRIRGPDIEIVAAMPGRGMHEAGAGIVGDVRP